MKWYRRIAESRRPDLIDRLGMTWVLFACRWFTVGVVLRTYSNIYAPKAVVSSLRLVLEGEMVDHQQVEEGTSAKRSPDSYRYRDLAGHVFDAMPAKPGQWIWRPKGCRWSVELMPARNQGDRIVDMPQWMRVDEVLTETEKQCWWLQIVFHKGPLK